MSRTMVRAAIVGAALLHAAAAAAQTTTGGGPGVFLDVNVGLAGRPGSLATISTFSLFGETGSAATTVQPGNSGMLDARIGVRAGNQFGVAAAVSGSRGDSVGQAT